MANNKKNLFGKQISLQKNKIPTKTHINLIHDEQKKADQTAIVLFILFMICLGFFVKFFVIDRLAEVNQLANQYNALQTQLNTLKENNKDYEEIKAQYDAVTDWYLTDDEKLEVDKLDVYEMIDQSVTPYIVVRAVNVSGNTITIQTGEATLSQVSTCVSMLQNDKRTSYVTVSTAQASSRSETENNVTASIIVTYTGNTTEGSDQ